MGFIIVSLLSTIILKLFKNIRNKISTIREFLPLEKILNKFGLKKITEGYGSFLKGEQQDNLKIEKLNISINLL